MLFSELTYLSIVKDPIVHWFGLKAPHPTALCPQYVLQLRNFHQGNLGRLFSADIPGRIGVIFGSIFYCNSTIYYRESQALYNVTNF
jgi:hypothetical protein